MSSSLSGLFAIQTLARSKMVVPRPAVDACRTSSLAHYLGFNSVGSTRRGLCHKTTIDIHPVRATCDVPAPFPATTPKDSEPSHTHSRSFLLAGHPCPGETCAVHGPSHSAPSHIHSWPRPKDIGEYAWRRCALGLGLAAHGPLFLWRRWGCRGAGAYRRFRGREQPLGIWTLGNGFCGERRCAEEEGHHGTFASLLTGALSPEERALR
ncbi:hypothetical protein DFH09DRAFT_215026 [Mycena vulgaris]|nr:hypothetical protein DFH09DRAFT_215026 [Mycena vulgaris]